MSGHRVLASESRPFSPSSHNALHTTTRMLFRHVQPKPPGSLGASGMRAHAIQAHAHACQWGGHAGIMSRRRSTGGCGAELFIRPVLSVSLYQSIGHALNGWHQNRRCRETMQAPATRAQDTARSNISVMHVSVLVIALDSMNSITMDKGRLLGSTWGAVGCLQTRTKATSPQSSSCSQPMPPAAFLCPCPCLPVPVLCLLLSIVAHHHAISRSGTRGSIAGWQYG